MSDQEQYEVEFIIGKRKKRGRLEYLVKWKGWDRPQDNSWLPLKNLKCQELIEEFEAKTGGKGQLMAESEEVVDVNNRENPAAGQKKKEKKKEKKKIVNSQRRKTLTPGQRRKEMKGPRVRLGFARGLTPEKITGVVQLPGSNEIIHLVKVTRHLFH